MGTKLLIEAPGISDSSTAGAAMVDHEPSADLAGGALLDTARPEVFKLADSDFGKD